MARQRIQIDATNQEELTAALIEISNQNPGRPITAAVHFGTVDVYVNRSLSTIPLDQLDTRQMLDSYDGKIAFLNGKLVEPTPGWAMARKIYMKKGYKD